MKVVRLNIANFRGIKSASLLFDGHTLMVGSNNVGKSTICEALDLVLSYDRLNRFPPVDEFDFYNAQYLAPPALEGVASEPIELRIEAVLLDPSEEVSVKCGGHVEYWHLAEQRLLVDGEAALANPDAVKPCLRIVTIGKYVMEDDEFVAKTYFSHSPDAPEGELTAFPRQIKKLFGFLYLRVLRTGSRALSLERGSLLDIILRTKGVRTALWEKSIARLKDLDIEDDAEELAPILRLIEKRLARYIPMEAQGNATKLHVTDLTREHLRKTMSFFLALSNDQSPVPFAHAGTGTLNTLVLALLSIIADLKPDTVIFAMEEPEIAVPPPTQRRITEYLLTKTTQAFVTSHSPFVIERFDPSQTLLLARDQGTVTARKVSDASGLTDREFKRFARWGLCECMLGKAVIVVEGLTEFHALPVAARRLGELWGAQPLDISGATFFYADGESNMIKFGKFFKTLGLRTFGIYDKAPRTAARAAELAEYYELNVEHVHKGFEDLIATEMPTAALWTFLCELRDSGAAGKLGVPPIEPAEDAIRKLAGEALRSHKGAGWAANLFDTCGELELPATVMAFFMDVFGRLPKLPDFDDALAEAAPTGGAGAAPLAPVEAVAAFAMAVVKPQVAVPVALYPPPAVPGEA